MLKVFIVAIALFAGLVACGGGPAQTADLHAGSAQMHVSVSPAIAGESNTITIQSDSAAVSAVALDMPDMQMPAKPYALQVRAPHQYEISNVSFSMAGTWRVRLLDSSGAPISSFTIAVR